jgi:hypothetical protein
LTLSRSVSLRTRIVSYKGCVENHSTHFTLSAFFFENHAVYENMEKYGGVGEATDDNIAHGHCVLDTKLYKHTLAIRTALPMQQWLQERASMLRYTYIACPVLEISNLLH